ncbi:MAG: Ku protein [Hamadaea sp.]|nr:Ku protein [Hamadaea sp.]
MARAIWTGVISFGLVSVPVEMYSATREHEVSFHQFERGTSDRIRYLRVNERTGKEVKYDDIVKGAPVGDGEYVLIEKGELDEIAPGRSKSLEIHQFVDLDEIDPIYFQKTYYLAPGSEETEKTYALLRDSMAEANRAAIATLVMRSKEYLATIRVDKNLLVLETMYFADEVRDPKDYIERIPGRSRARGQELAMAGKLIDSMTGPWRPADFRDTYTDRVKDLIEAKQKGNEVTAAERAPEATNVIDLMEVLRRSVEQARQGRPRPTSGKPAEVRELRSGKKPSKKRAAREELREMSKTDLLALARELDVPGRSSMTRDELEKAVAKARKPKKRAA